MLTEAGVPSARIVGLRYRGGQGTHSWVGSGVMTVIGSPDFGEGPGYNNADQRRFWIQGTTSATGAPGTFARRELAGNGTMAGGKSRVTLADLRLSDVVNGEPVCEPALGIAGDAQVRRGLSLHIVVLALKGHLDVALRSLNVSRRYDCDLTF